MSAQPLRREPPLDDGATYREDVLESHPIPESITAATDVAKTALERLIAMLRREGYGSSADYAQESLDGLLDDDGGPWGLAEEHRARVEDRLADAALPDVDRR